MFLEKTTQIIQTCFVEGEKENIKGVGEERRDQLLSPPGVLRQSPHPWYRR